MLLHNWNITIQSLLNLKNDKWCCKSATKTTMSLFSYKLQTKTKQLWTPPIQTYWPFLLLESDCIVNQNVPRRGNHGQRKPKCDLWYTNISFTLGISTEAITIYCCYTFPNRCWVALRGFDVRIATYDQGSLCQFSTCNMLMPQSYFERQIHIS